MALLRVNSSSGAVAEPPLRCALDSRGVVAFEANSAHALPSIWVTGPTRETTASGLILNANFDVDAGRGALGSARVVN